MPKKGKKSKKKVAPKQGEEEGENVPKTFIFHQGKVIPAVKNLISDLKNAFAPWTAKNLKPTSKNVLKDYLSLAGPYGISHFLIFSQTTLSTNLRIAKTLYGPTMFFRVHKYSLRSDMVKIQRRALSIQPQDLETPPLVVLNNFSGNEYNVSLMKLMFQNMFPPINVKEVVLREYRRVVLFHYDKDIDRVYFRHFLITLNPLGMSKSIKRLAQYKVPNLSKLEDIADYVKIGAKATDSDLEDESEAKLDIEEEYNGVLNKTDMQRRSAVRLYEIGPRMELELIKIEQGFCSGEVQYHRYVEKTEEEREELKKEIERRKQIKAERKKRQEENVLKKQKEKEVDEKEDVDNDNDNEFDDEDDDEDSDLEWYRKEVGEEPPEDLKKSVAASNLEDKEKKEKFHPFSYKKKKKGEGEEGGDNNQKVDKSPKGKKSQRDNNKNNKNNKSNRKDSRTKSTPFQSGKRKSLDGKKGGGDKKKRFKK